MSEIPENISEEDIEKIIEEFGTSSMNIRLELTKKIISLGKKAVPALIKGLSHKTWSVRQDCANALADVGDERAIEPLKITLNDDETGVRYESARALSKIGGEDEKKILLDMAQKTDDDEYRHFLYDCASGRIE